ncbi:MAG: PmoA family protein [Limnochordia bacterium]
MEYKIRVHGGNHRRQGTPVRLALPEDLAGKKIKLKDERTGLHVCSQVLRQGDQDYLCWLLDDVLPNEVRTYAVLTCETESCATCTGVTLEDNDGAVRFLVGEELVTAYNYKDYSRPYLYPLIGPFGHGVTRDFPMKDDTPEESHDHPHHRSVFTAFGDISGINNWADVGKMPLGAMEHQEFTALDSGPVLGRLEARNVWTGPGEGAMLDEVREIVLFATAPSYRLFEYRVSLTARKDVVFNDTKEGGILSVRVASSMDARRGGRIENAQGGVNETEAWGKPSPWCDYSGIVSGHEVGIALMDHPGNFRHPTPWHVRNYGLMTANCFGLSEFTKGKLNGTHEMTAGDKLEFTYRILVHAGDAKAGEVSRHYADFAYAPQVELLRDGQRV